MAKSVSKASLKQLAPAVARDDVGLPPADAVNERLNLLAAAFRRDGAGEHHGLLLVRFTLLNLACGSLLAVAFRHGLVDKVITADKTGICIGIFTVFVVGLAICGVKVLRTSRELDCVHDFQPLRKSRAADYLAQLRRAPADGRSIAASALKLKLSHHVGLVRQIASSLVLLGLIGTVVGFIIALSGVDPARASDISAIGPMVSTLIEGMSTALYTTLVGAVLNLWLMANHRLLSSGTVHLITALVEFGERHART